MQLVIDIDKNDYYRFINGFASDDDSPLIEKLFKNGVPLEKVIEDIKTEINNLKTKGKHNTSFQFDTGIDEFIKIIDKHISGTEKKYLSKERNECIHSDEQIWMCKRYGEYCYENNFIDKQKEAGMTREEKAIQMFKTALEAKQQLNTCGIIGDYDFRVGEEFFNSLKIAIEVLEKKLVIEDIKAEIEHIGGDDEKAFCKNLNESYKQGLKDVLNIIDKHISKKE